MSSLDQFIQMISVGALPILFAITLHEAAHAYAAWYFGDDTAYRMGRTSFNPLHHIEPFGTILLPLMTLYLFNLPFGWAKPVPVDFGRLRHPKKDMLWVAIAGPASNLLMAVGWGLLGGLAAAFPGNYFAEPLSQMAVIGVFINAILLVLNMLPIPPLDGGRVTVSLLPMPYAVKLARIEPYGIWILLFLAFSGVLDVLLNPLIGGVKRLIFVLSGM